MLFRRIEPILQKDLAKKMVMIAGPRQCGTLSFACGSAYNLGGRVLSPSFPYPPIANF